MDYEDEDGIDGPFERAMRAAEREDAVERARTEQRIGAALGLPPELAIAELREIDVAEGSS